MENKKNNITIKSIILLISLAIIAIAITIIIRLGIGIEIFKLKAQANYKSPDVAAKQLNKLNSKELKLDGKTLLAVDLNTVAVSHKLNKLNKLGNKLGDRQLVAKDLRQLENHLVLTELKDSRLLLDNKLNDNHNVLDLVSLQLLAKLQPRLPDLA
jgi:hypothetical protein